MYTILGAGLSGLSIADHLNKNNVSFDIYESQSHGGGHIHSTIVDGFMWDEGPHVSFTPHEYVRNYFEENCNGEFLEYPTKPVNYYSQNWIDHPAQANMYQVPEPLRTKCVNSLLAMRNGEVAIDAKNYGEWITYAFGRTFADNFPRAYTKKYWTTEPESLSTDWIGKRIYFPEINDMVKSAEGPLNKQTHYISKVRYPEKGGFYSFIKRVEDTIPVKYEKKVSYISFNEKRIDFESGETVYFDKLINTLPLPLLIKNSDAPEAVKSAAQQLKCSQVLLINVIADHPTLIENHWIYVYDEHFYATRINFTDLLSPNNGIPGKSGIQVEVYFSDYHPLDQDEEEIAKTVINELIAMKLIRSKEAVVNYHHKWIQWANVIFDIPRIPAQEIVLAFLETKGLVRESDDLEPMTDWNEKEPKQLGDLVLAGRFAQWKYYWTDDCVMRAKYIADNISK